MSHVAIKFPKMKVFKTDFVYNDEFEFLKRSLSGHDWFNNLL